jgi:WD40 repeat protein
MGATLYKVLTGRPPFDGTDVLTVLANVRKGHFSPPREVKPAVPPALEAVCLKAMRLDPEDRYASALDLAADLERWLSDEPVSAWKEPWSLRCRRWLKQHRTLMIASAATLLVALVLSILAAAILGDRNRQLKAALEASEANRYYNNITLADRVWSDGQVKLAEQILDESPRRLRAWEWDYLKRRCYPELLTRPIATGPVEALSWLPDGSHFATISRGAVAVWDSRNGQHVRSFADDIKTVTLGIFSRDGRRFAAVAEQNPRQITVWETETGRTIDAVTVPGGTVETLVFSGDGSHLAIVGSDRPTQTKAARLARAQPAQADLWVIVRVPATGHHRNRFPIAGAGRLGRPAFSADNRHFSVPVVGLLSTSVQVYDVDSGRSIASANSLDEATGRLGGGLAVLSPDGLRLAEPAEGFTITIRDARTRATVTELRGHTDRISQLQFGADGRFLVSASIDRSARIWDLRTGRVVSLLRGIKPRVEHLALSADGRLLLLAGEGQTRIWNISDGSDSRVVQVPGSDPISELVFEPDGQSFATVSDGFITLRDTATGHERPRSGKRNICLVCRPHGRLLVQDNGRKMVVFQDSRGGQRPLSLRPEDLGAVLDFTADGRMLASVGTDRSVTLRDTGSGLAIRTLRGHASEVTALAFSPDGRRLATGGSDGAILLSDVDSGAAVLTLRESREPVRCLAFQPSGRELVSATSEDDGGSLLTLDETKIPGELRTWDLEKGALRFSLNGHAAGVSSATYSPDGLRIVSADTGGVVKLWDSVTGRELLTLRGPTLEVRKAAFTPDGRRIISAGGMANPIRALGVGEIVIWCAQPVN